MAPSLSLRILPGLYTVCQLVAGAAIPAWATNSAFFAVVATLDELSLVCAGEQVPPDVRQEANWRLLQVVGPLDFALTGVLSALTVPLAGAGVSIFALASYNTDYLLIRAHQLDAALLALGAAGHHVEDG
jgi:hypothetical protein